MLWCVILDVNNYPVGSEIRVICARIVLQGNFILWYIIESVVVVLYNL